jgi:hypothetical protein
MQAQLLRQKTLMIGNESAIMYQQHDADMGGTQMPP